VSKTSVMQFISKPTRLREQEKGGKYKRNTVKWSRRRRYSPTEEHIERWWFNEPPKHKLSFL